MKTVYSRIMQYSQVSKQIQSVTVYNKQFIIINYVSEYQLSSVIGASHGTPITHVNRHPMLLKMNGWRHCPYFRWVPYISETTVQMPDAESEPTFKQSVTVTIHTVSLWNNTHSNTVEQKTDGMSVIPRNLAVDPYLSCEICILGPSKIQTLSPPSIFPIPV